ncbi:MAG: trigger factor [Oscillospiraceae bacterium]|nr:trigger factor [Oscillospiraceae bacterium]MDE5883817.1 trigger factor [Oscillospiraceae bacterium]
MSLKSTTKTDVNTVELVFEVTAEEFEQAVERAYQKARKNISLPGFRKGKVSRKMAETRMGEGVFYEDALNQLINTELPKALVGADFELVDSPQVTAEKVSKTEGAQFKAVCITKPDVQIADYKGIKASKTVKEVTDADVNSQLEILRQRNARLVSVDDRAAQLGDEANINFEGFIDGVAFEGGKGENFPLRLGSGQFIPGFEDQIVGKNINEEFDVTVTFPENYQMEEFAGKEAVFKCKLNGITVEELPEADDEFIQDSTEFETLDAYKEDTRKNLEQNAVRDADIAFDNAIMDALIQKVDTPIPNCMYEHRIDELVRNFEQVLSQQGMNIELYLQYTGMDMNDFREANRDRAENEVKLRLALEKIAALENIQVSEEEINESLKPIAEANKMTVDEVKRRLPMTDYVTDLRVTKALELVKANADTSVDSATEEAAQETAPAEEA